MPSPIDAQWSSTSAEAQELKNRARHLLAQLDRLDGEYQAMIAASRGRLEASYYLLNPSGLPSHRAESPGVAGTARHDGQP